MMETDVEHPEAEQSETEAASSPEAETLSENAEQTATESVEQAVDESLSAEEILPDDPAPEAISIADAQLIAVLEAIIYVTDEPLSLDQIADAVEQPRERIALLLEQLCAEYDRPERGLSIREIAGGFRMTTKAEHHEAVRRFVKNLNPPIKLSLPALETLAVIAYKQPITAPEIMDIRGVQGAGVLKTLLDRKLIAVAGRKQVIGKPILYKTTRDFLVQFGLKNLNELPTLKEFQELGSLSNEASGEPAQARLIEMPAHGLQEDAGNDEEATEEKATEEEAEQQ